MYPGTTAHQTYASNLEHLWKGAECWFNAFQDDRLYDYMRAVSKKRVTITISDLPFAQDEERTEAQAKGEAESMFNKHSP